MAQKYSPAWRRSLWVIGRGGVWVERVSVPRGTYLCFLRFPACVLRCLLACLAVDPDGHGAVVRQRYLHVGAEATRADGATESLLKGANDLAVEGFGDLGASGDIVVSIPNLSAASPMR